MTAMAMPVMPSMEMPAIMPKLLLCKFALCAGLAFIVALINPHGVVYCHYHPPSAPQLLAYYEDNVRNYYRHKPADIQRMKTTLRQLGLHYEPQSSRLLRQCLRKSAGARFALSVFSKTSYQDFPNRREEIERQQYLFVEEV